jgi:hypothetical protein
MEVNDNEEDDIVILLVNPNIFIGYKTESIIRPATVFSFTGGNSIGTKSSFTLFIILAMLLIRFKKKLF